MTIDYGVWGFWISVASLFLAIPLGILGTALAPSVLGWWYGRSLRSARARLSKITSEYDAIRLDRVEPEFRSLVLLGFQVVALTGWSAVAVMTIGMLLESANVADNKIDGLGWTPQTLMATVIAFTLAAVMFKFQNMALRSRAVRLLAIPKEQKALEEKIAKATARAPNAA